MKRTYRGQATIASALSYIDGPSMGISRREIRDILEGRLEVDAKGRIVE